MFSLYSVLVHPQDELLLVCLGASLCPLTLVYTWSGHEDSRFQVNFPSTCVLSALGLVFGTASHPAAPYEWALIYVIASTLWCCDNSALWQGHPNLWGICRLLCCIIDFIIICLYINTTVFSNSHSQGRMTPVISLCSSQNMNTLSHSSVAMHCRLQACIGDHNENIFKISIVSCFIFNQVHTT